MYRHLNSEEKNVIELGFLLKKSCREIAFVVGRHHSSIARELKRSIPFQPAGYSALVSEELYDKRRQKGGPCRKIRGEFKRWITAKIKLQWSPEQIVGRAVHEGQPKVAIETVYRFLYRDKELGGELWKNLRRCRPKRKRRFPRHTWRKIRPGLGERPVEANERSQLGHFERDLIEGPRESGSAMLTIVDRKSRLVRIEKLEGKWSAGVHAATVKAMWRLKVRSITNDNGLEFSSFDQTSMALKVPVFFTRAYASWERGSIENMNGLIRQYFPKKTDLKEVSYAEIQRVQKLLNDRPRKTLGWFTPLEVHQSKSPRPLR